MSKHNCEGESVVEAEGEDFLFGRLPVEIQLVIIQQLDVHSQLQMCAVSRGWNEGVKNLVTFDYKQAVLSDRTADHVLAFPHKIRSITATNLTNKRKVLTAIAPFGVVHLAEKLILGERVDPRITKKLLKTATDVKTMVLGPVDTKVGDAFLRFPALFDNVTEFGLKLQLNSSNLNEEEFFLRKLSHWRKFPNLLRYNVDWNLEVGAIRTLEHQYDIVLLHSIYISLHNFLHTHRTTVYKINWDFGSLIILGLPDYIKNVANYMGVKNKMTQVSLKEVDIRMNELEGQDYWDLTKTLLRNQFSLSKLSFMGASQRYSSQPIRFVTNPFGDSTDLVEQNQFTLTDLCVENRIFSFYSIENCSTLKKLVLKGACIVSTTPLNHIAFPQGIEELCLDFNFLFTPDIVNLMNWFPKLTELKMLTLHLKMQWMTSTPILDVFPTADDFPALFDPPKLTTLILHFDVSTAYKLHLLKQKGADLKNRLEKLNGLTMIEKHSFKESKFTLHFKLNRSIFKGIPLV